MDSFGKNFKGFSNNLSATFTPLAARTQQMFKEQFGQDVEKVPFPSRYTVSNLEIPTTTDSPSPAD